MLGDKGFEPMNTVIIFLKLDINSAINNSTSTNQTRFGAKFGLVELFAEFPVSVYYAFCLCINSAFISGHLLNPAFMNST